MKAPIPPIKRNRSFESYRRACQKASDKLDLALDLISPDDLYDIDAEMRAAWKRREQPLVFIQQSFAEDIARQAGDQAYADAMEPIFDDGETD